MQPIPCHRPLSRASRQLFRQDASQILLHYFGGKGQDAPWRQRHSNDEVDEIDKRGRKRKCISLVNDPADDLSDEEWYALLGYAIDQSMPSAKTDSNSMCPLHPKHDMLLPNDRRSFLIRRRYRMGSPKFGAFSLPLSGRAARTSFWLEERESHHRHHQHQQHMTATQLASTVFLFQCGICDKTFVNQYYLDKHMETHHSSQDPSTEFYDNQLICPADNNCESLGGVVACMDTMHQISPFYGRGLLHGKEYAADENNESLLSSSLHSLISHLHDDDELTDGSAEDTSQDATMTSQMKAKRLKEADVVKVTGEMRHRASARNKLLMQAIAHRRLMQSKGMADGEANLSEYVNKALLTDGSNFENDKHESPFSISSLTSCDEKEMERYFHRCQDTMQTCFGGVTSTPNDATKFDSNLANELITHICEPLHCHDRLHRMAGHDPRHVTQYADHWDEHHSFSLGWSGWIVVLGLLLYYGCVVIYDLASDENDGNLPSHGRKKKSI